MTSLALLIPIIKEAIADVQALQGTSTSTKKQLAISIIDKLIIASNLTQDEKDLLDTVLPLVVMNIEDVEADVKGCFACLCKKKK
jgi:hypothetical protein